MKNITIGGRLTRDAELRDVGGTALLSFSVAVDDSKRVDGQRVKSTLFFDCSLFGTRGTALHSYLVKGKAVAVSGEFSLREFARRDGSPGFSPSVRVSDVTMLGGGGDQGDNQGGRYGGQSQSPSFSRSPSQPPPPSIEDDDIPF